MKRLAFFIFVLGVVIVQVGISWAGFGVVLVSLYLLALIGIASVGYTVEFFRAMKGWGRQVRVRHSFRQASPLAEKLAPQLYGEFSPYVIEAAEKLGEAKDMTAVPTLLYVLENCVNSQRPGWRDVAEALTNSLARIGDRRALPLLYRLENVRGIGIIPAIRNAIASIEPQTSLLRPGSADSLPPETLLRPVNHRHSDEAPVLLRPIESEPP